MNLSEFKAWLEGFNEAIGDAPTPEQWAKIMAKLKDVNGFPTGPAPRTIDPHFGRYMPVFDTNPLPRDWGLPPAVTCGAAS